jgi:hypothetical protein
MGVERERGKKTFYIY